METQKCGKWCKCGRPATWKVVEIGNLRVFCEKCAQAEHDFGIDDNETTWYRIPQELQETEYSVRVSGYNKPMKDLAQSIHRMRFDVIEQFYSDVAEELMRQAHEAWDEGSHSLGKYLEQASCDARDQQKKFAEMRSLSIASQSEEEKQYPS